MKPVSIIRHFKGANNHGSKSHITRDSQLADSLQTVCGEYARRRGRPCNTRANTKKKRRGRREFSFMHLVGGRQPPARFTYKRMPSLLMTSRNLAPTLAFLVVFLEISGTCSPTTMQFATKTDATANHSSRHYLIANKKKTHKMLK